MKRLMLTAALLLVSAAILQAQQPAASSDSAVSNDRQVTEQDNMLRDSLSIETQADSADHGDDGVTILPPSNPSIPPSEYPLTPPDTGAIPPDSTRNRGNLEGLDH